MRTFSLAALAALLLTAPAQALCYTVPEDSAWDGPQRNTARTLCLQRELSQDTNDRADDVRWKAQLDALAARTEQMLQQQRALTTLDRQRPF
jgi:hypothetical protein